MIFMLAWDAGGSGFFSRFRLVRVPARKAGGSGSNSGPIENCSLKLTQDLLEGYSEKLNLLFLSQMSFSIRKE